MPTICLHLFGVRLGSTGFYLHPLRLVVSGVVTRWCSGRIDAHVYRSSGSIKFIYTLSVCVLRKLNKTF